MGDGRVRMLARGELDLAGAPELEAVLRRELDAGRSVLLDLAGLDFMDSTGVRTLHVLTRETAEADPASFAIAPELRPAVRQVLELTAVLALLPFEPPPG